MDLPWLEISNNLHALEEVKIPLPTSKSVLMATAIGIPIAVLLHDTSDYWLPAKFNIPILSWFQRKWTQDRQNKRSHLRILRNALMFAWMVCAIQEGEPKFLPIDYIAERLTNNTARKSITNDIMQSRRAAFGATHQVIGEAAIDEANARQQRDAALRRRHSQEIRRASK